MTNANAVSSLRAIGRALLISNDGVAIKQLSESMQQLHLYVEVCQDITAALRLLNQRKFEAVVVDVGGDAKAVLEEIRLTPSNRTVVIFAISENDGEASEALKSGASFVVLKPFSPLTIEDILWGAYDSIVRERSRYFRYPVQIPASIQDSDRQETDSVMVNISAGGFGIAASAPLKVGNKVAVQFTLPDHPSRFAAEAMTCWRKGPYMGLQFVPLPPSLESTLQEWLSLKLKEYLPLLAAADKIRGPGNALL